MRTPKALVKRGAKVALLTGAMLFACSNIAQAAQSSTDNKGGILNGNTVGVPITVPINVCGLGIGAVLGIGNGNADCTNIVVQPTSSSQHSGGNEGGILSGNNVEIPITAPINICGLGVGIAGIGNGNADCTNVIKPPAEHEKPKPPPHKPCEKCEHHKPPHKPEHPKPHKPVNPPTPLHPGQPPHKLAVTGVPAENQLGLGLGLIAVGGIATFAGRRRSRVRPIS